MPRFLGFGNEAGDSGGDGLRPDLFATEWKSARRERPRDAVLPRRAPFLKMLSHAANDERTPKKRQLFRSAISIEGAKRSGRSPSPAAPRGPSPFASKRGMSP